MSTPLLDPFRFAKIRASLMHHGTDELQPGRCSCINGEIFRTFGLDAWGRTSTDHDAPVNLAAARLNLQTAVNAAVFDWQRANWAAHVARYEQPAEAWQEQGGPARPSPRLPRGKILSVPALTKALRALRYNCDGGSASGETVKASLEKLDALIEVLRDSCLEMLPEYRDAEWAI